MDLPILKSVTATPTQGDLMRHVHKLLREWSNGIAEADEIDAGVAITNTALPLVAEANALLDADMQSGESADAVIALVNTHFTAKNLSCQRWVMNSALAAGVASELAGALVANGFQRRATPVLYAPLGALQTSSTSVAASVMILPARAAYTAGRVLAERITQSAQHANAMMAHLDDPRYDALLAIRDGQAIARAGVVAVGDMGLLAGFESIDDAMEDSLADVLLDRAIDFCRRSQFKHVFATGVSDLNRLTNRGFTVVGDYIEFVRQAG